MNNLNEMIRDKTVVVIDTETTGVDPNKEKIYEISARKIVDGKMISDLTQTLSLFRNNVCLIMKRVEYMV